MIDKKVRLIAVLGETAEQATMLLTKILRSAGFIVSTLNQEEHSCKDALMTASKICDFLKDFNLETILVLCDAEEVNADFIEKFNNIVLPYSFSENLSIKEKNVLFYSINSNEADLIAKNINPQDDKTVFELLGTGVIGRVKLSKSSQLSVELVLAVSSTLVAMGVPLAVVLNVINQL